MIHIYIIVNLYHLLYPTFGGPKLKTTRNGTVTTNISHSHGYNAGVHHWDLTSLSSVLGFTHLATKWVSWSPERAALRSSDAVHRWVILIFHDVLKVDHLRIPDDVKGLGKDREMRFGLSSCLQNCYPWTSQSKGSPALTAWSVGWPWWMAYHWFSKP